MSRSAKDPPSPGLHGFALEESSIRDLKRLLDAGGLSSRELVSEYLSRVEEVDRTGPSLRSYIETNPDALGIAEELDTERRRGHIRGALHGVPILLKDNIATADRMSTSAGSLALAGTHSVRDSAVATRLRRAGAILLGKANMSEWANFRASRSISGWSARGGQCRNPYVLNRSPLGSSSGSAAACAANLCAAAVGTETDGSIIAPAHACGIVGIKPTVGLVSRSGVIPIAHSQDTIGPLARTVEDAALLLAVLIGRDATDRATQQSPYLTAWQWDAPPTTGRPLHKRRLGVVRQGVYGKHSVVDSIFDQALDVLRGLGAELVDPVDLPLPTGFRQNEVLLHEFGPDLRQYLSSYQSGSPIRTLEDVISFNETHRDQELVCFGQDMLRRASERKSLSTPQYRRARRSSRALARATDELISTRQLDALVAPTGLPAFLIDPVNGDCSPGGSWSLSAACGYPQVTVPAGFVASLPVGVSFFGVAWSEKRLLAIAHAYERATGHRRAPAFLQSTALEPSGGAGIGIEQQAVARPRNAPDGT